MCYRRYDRPERVLAWFYRGGVDLLGRRKVDVKIMWFLFFVYFTGTQNHNTRVEHRRAQPQEDTYLERRRSRRGGFGHDNPCKPRGNFGHTRHTNCDPE